MKNNRVKIGVTILSFALFSCRKDEKTPLSEVNVEFNKAVHREVEDYISKNNLKSTNEEVVLIEDEKVL